MNDHLNRPRSPAQKVSDPERTAFAYSSLIDAGFRYLILQASAFMLSEWVYILGRPETAFPYPLVFLRGPVSHVRPAGVVCRFYVDLFIVGIAGCLYSSAVLSAFRFSQTVDGSVCRMLSNPRQAVTFNAFILLLVFTCILVPLHSQWESDDMMLLYVGESNAQLRTRMSSVGFAGFTVSRHQEGLTAFARTNFRRNHQKFIICGF